MAIGNNWGSSFVSSIQRQKGETATVISQTYSDLYRLDRELFEEVLRRYPKIAAHIKKIADERVVQNVDIFKKDS